MIQYAGESKNNSISKTMQSEDRKSNGRISKIENFIQALNFMNNKKEKELKQNRKAINYKCIPSKSQIPAIKPTMIHYEPQISFENSENCLSAIHCSREEEFVRIILKLIRLATPN